MTVKTRENLKASQASALYENNVLGIGPADIRQQFADLTDSAKLAEDLVGHVVSAPDVALYPNATPIPRMFRMPKADYDQLPENLKNDPNNLIVVVS